MAAKKKTIDEAAPLAVENQVVVQKIELPAARKPGRIVGEGGRRARADGSAAQRSQGPLGTRRSPQP
jgi:hypothetical protein